MANTGTLKADLLSKGLTRPTMILGVSLSFFALNLVGIMSTYIITQRFTVLIFGMPITHAIGYFASFKEPLFMELFLIRSQKCNKCKNRVFYGANSYDTLQ